MYVSSEYKGVGKQPTNVLLLCLFLHRESPFISDFKNNKYTVKVKTEKYKVSGKKTPHYPILTKQSG